MCVTQASPSDSFIVVSLGSPVQVSHWLVVGVLTRLQPMVLCVMPLYTSLTMGSDRGPEFRATYGKERAADDG